MNPRPRKLLLLRWLPGWLVQTRGRRAGRTLYLTFDDGPHPEHTPRLLDLLARHDARASFFLVGREVEKHPDIVRRIVAEGHLIGNHSYSHPVFTRIPLSDQLGEIDRMDGLLAGFDGQEKHLFRPPSGALPVSLVAHFARKRRCISYWSYDSLDYQRPQTAEFVERLRGTPPESGEIVLMHDDAGLVVDALAELIPEWRAEGYLLQSLPAA